MASVSTKSVNHGATLLKQLIRKLDAKGRKDGYFSNAERNSLQGKPGTSAEAILAVDHAVSSAKQQGDRTVKGVTARVDVAKKLLLAADRDGDGKISDTEKVPNGAGKTLAQALLRFAKKHQRHGIDHFEIPKAK